MINKAEFGETVAYLSSNYWNLFCKCKVLQFLFHEHLLSLIEFVKVPLTKKSKHYCYAMLYLHVPQKLYEKSFAGSNDNVTHHELLAFFKLLTNNGMNIIEFCKISDSYESTLYSIASAAMKWNDLQLFELFLDLMCLNSDNNGGIINGINDIMYRDNDKRANTCFLVEYVVHYHKHPNNVFAQMIFDKYPNIDINKRIYGKTKKSHITPFHLQLF